jgi:hypothetical protein
LDEGVQGRPLQPDVLAELDVANPALGDEPADEPLTGSQVVAGLAGVSSSSGPATLLLMAAAATGWEST